jgi:hydroxymethylpyrimidine pyrophosphatase-like HAD family hydrolase
VWLIASDIDGTMTRAGRLCPRVLEAAQALAAAGVELVPISGRPAGEVLGLARYLPGVRLAGAENGLVRVEPGVGVRALGLAPDRARLRACAATLAPASAPLRDAEDAFCRLADLAFERDGRDDATLAAMAAQATAQGVALVWSNVHVHLSLEPPDKGRAAAAFAAERGLGPEAVLTIGDAPNDAGLWRRGAFGVPVGCAQVLDQRAVLAETPAWLVAEAADGWLEMAALLLRARA